jgi:structure-specific endonuclease subunit SLX1
MAHAQGENGTGLDSLGAHGDAQVQENTQNLEAQEVAERGASALDEGKGGLSGKYFVYWIHSGARSYIGATVSPERRIRQHNRELKGGARRTHQGHWKLVCTVSGFRTWKEALQFEWAFKFYTRRCRGMQSRAQRLGYVISRERWTSNSPLSSTVPLSVKFEEDLSLLSQEINTACADGGESGVHERSWGTTTPCTHPSASTRVRAARRRWRKSLHGVSY